MSKILIVDDNRISRLLLEECVDSGGYQYESACDGVEALRILSCSNFDLVLLDINMPGMSGIECCKSIKRYRDIPVIFITMETFGEDMLGVDYNGYIMKPISVNEVLEKIGEFL